MAAMLIPIITSLLSSASSDGGSGTYQKPTIDWNSLITSYDDGLDLTDEEREQRRKNLWEGYL